MVRQKKSLIEVMEIERKYRMARKVAAEILRNEEKKVEETEHIKLLNELKIAGIPYELASDYHDDHYIIEVNHGQCPRYRFRFYTDGYAGGLQMCEAVWEMRNRMSYDELVSDIVDYWLTYSERI